MNSSTRPVSGIQKRELLIQMPLLVHLLARPESSSKCNTILSSVSNKKWKTALERSTRHPPASVFIGNADYEFIITWSASIASFLSVLSQKDELLIAIL